MAIPVPMLAACIAFLAVPLHAQGQSGGLAVSDNRVGTAGSAEASLETFSDPVELWGSGIEAVIEGAYRECFRTFILGGRIMTLRMPFAQNNERAELAGADLDILGGGKADPAGLWDAIEALLRLDDFALYAALLSDGREKVLIFDLASRGWSASYDLFDIARMKAGAYRGLPHKPYVLSSGKGMQATDIYNYLFCVGRLGMDCSGFAWHILKAIGLASGVDLERQLARTLRVPRGADPSLYVGTAFFDSRSTELAQPGDRLRDLLPGDVILFRGSDGQAVHSAVIQAINLEEGWLRYLQSTDEAPPAERGVHDSYVYFDPGRTELSLKDPSLVWSQSRFPPFPGEKASAFSNDGERYRAFPEFGGGKVVRLKLLADAASRIKSRSR